MHEVGLAGEIVRLVEEAAMRDGFAQVAFLRVEAGALSGVDAGALRFALETISADSACLAGAELRIDVPPGQAHCPRCGTTLATTDPLAVCASCGHFPLSVTGGDQLRVVELRVHDAPPPTSA